MRSFRYPHGISGKVWIGLDLDVEMLPFEAKLSALIDFHQFGVSFSMNLTNKAWAGC